jgi:MFS family permease
MVNTSKYGKLSDIFGRKVMLQVAYFLFALGGAIWFVVLVFLIFRCLSWFP